MMVGNTKRNNKSGIKKNIYKNTGMKGYFIDEKEKDYNKYKQKWLWLYCQLFTGQRNQYNWIDKKYYTRLMSMDTE